MKYCEDYAALLDPYIDGELSPEDTARVREHLKACDGCRAYVQAALLLRENFPEIEDTQVPDGFAESVMGAIRSGAAPQKKRRPPWAKVLVPLAACCAIVVLLKSMPLGFTGAAETVVTEETAADAAESSDTNTAPDSSCAAVARTVEPEDTAEEQESLSVQRQSQDSAADAQPYVFDSSGGEDETADSENNAAAQPQEQAGDTPEVALAADTPHSGAAQPESDTDQPKSEAADGAIPPERDAADEDSTTVTAESATEDTAETTSGDPEAWVEYDNVIFTCTVYLKPAYVGDALAEFEGLPYSSAADPGLTGTGYAMEAAEALHILEDLLNYPLELTENPQATTPLYCIVITDADCAVG